MNDRAVVYLEQCRRYDSPVLMNFFETCFKKEGMSRFHGDKVLIKPNLISAQGNGLACTDPQFILALAEWFQHCGAQVTIGDSPAFGRAHHILKTLGIEKELENRGIGITDFQTTVTQKLNCGIEVEVAAEPLECDLFVNAPKLKAHSQMYMTIAVKNIFGIVKGMRKALLHMQYGGNDNMFSKIILDLVELLPRNVSVMDGIDAMHKEGPISGEHLNLGCVALSTDPVALDTALLNALELQPESSPLWLEARSRKCSGSEITQITFPHCSFESFHGSLFEAPDELAPIRFSPIRFFKGMLKRMRLKILGKSKIKL